MSSVVKLFHTLKEFYKVFGSLNALHVFRLTSFVAAYISTTAFYFFKAETDSENGTSFYVSITLLVVAINTSITVAKMDQILELIEKYEQFIGKSWSNSNDFQLFPSLKPVWNTLSISRTDLSSGFIAHLHRIG